MSTESIILPPGGGRAYESGAMHGVFNADGPETQDRYCASERSVEPRRAGPDPHHHDANKKVVLVTEGTMSFLIGERRIEAPMGTFLRIPTGVTHHFENRSEERAAAFNLFIPGGFEAPFRERVEAAEGSAPS